MSGKRVFRLQSAAENRQPKVVQYKTRSRKTLAHGLLNERYHTPMIQQCTRGQPVKHHVFLVNSAIFYVHHVMYLDEMKWVMWHESCRMSHDP